MYPELDHYISNIDGLIRQLSPTEQNRLMADIGRKMRQVSSKRIKTNFEPSGRKMKGRRKGNKDYLEGYRKLRAGENLPLGKEFIYDGPYTRNPSRLRTLINIKTPQSDAKYGNIWRYHQGGGRYQRTNYDPKYIHGYSSIDGESRHDGVFRFNREHIYLAGSRATKLKEDLMFRKIHQYKYLKQQKINHGVAIGFLGGLEGAIAASHQYGEGNRPERTLLGFSADDLADIENILIKYYEKYVGSK